MLLQRRIDLQGMQLMLSLPISDGLATFGSPQILHTKVSEDEDGRRRQNRILFSLAVLVAVFT